MALVRACVPSVTRPTPRLHYVDGNAPVVSDGKLRFAADGFHQIPEEDQPVSPAVLDARPCDRRVVVAADAHGATDLAEQRGAGSRLRAAVRAEAEPPLNH